MLIEFGNTVVRPDWEINEAEAIDYIRVYYVVAGEATFFSDKQQCNLKKGHFYILPNTIPYRITRNKSMDFACTYLHIDVAPILITGIIDFAVTEGTGLYHYACMIRQLIFEHKEALLRSLSESIIYLCKESEYCVSNSIISATVKDYILNHLHEKITIEQLSDLFHYNTNYFIDVFKEKAGCTPYQYILRIRMQIAFKYLKSGMKINEVASKVGYTDISTFRHAFAKYYGMPPGACIEATDNHP